MKTPTSTCMLIVAVVMGLILAYVFLFPSGEPLAVGVGAPATPSSVVSTHAVPASPAASAPVTAIPPVPPSAFIPAPFPVTPPTKPQPQLDDAIRLPPARGQ